MQASWSRRRRWEPLKNGVETAEPIMLCIFGPFRAQKTAPVWDENQNSILRDGGKIGPYPLAGVSA